MAVASTMLPLGTEAPPFALTDVRTGSVVSSEDVTGPLLVMFICNHCPYVKHLRHGLASLSEDYAESAIDVIAISSNDVDSYPDDAPQELSRVADEEGYRFPILYDESQQVARAYRAACTPDFFLFDRDQRLVYRGQFDGARPGNDVPVTGEDLREAMDAVLADRRVPGDQLPSMGCSIKWKAGNEPVSIG